MSAARAAIRRQQRPPCPIPVSGRARPPKSGKPWPNPTNLVPGVREQARRMRQMAKGEAA